MDRLHPREAEAAVLGGIITKNALLEEVNLTENDFEFGPHGWVWRAMVDLHKAGTAIDELTLEHALSQRPSWYQDSTLLEKSGGIGFLSELALRCPNTENTIAYAEIVKEGSNLRRLQRLAGDVSARVERGDSYASVREMLLEVSEEAPGPGGTAATLADVKHTSSPGLNTGLGIEKYVPGGIPRDKVTTLFGESGHGKSTLKNAIMFNIARDGHRVMDVSLEDSATLTVARYLAQKHGLSYGQIAAGVVPAPELDDADKEVLGRIVDGSRLSGHIDDILRTVLQEQVSAVFIDYVQLLDGCHGDHVALAEAVSKSQRFAKEHNVAMVLVSQLKQDVAFRATQRDQQGRMVGDPRPAVGDCLGSSSLRTGTKLGIGLLYPFKYAKVPTHESGPYGTYARWANNYPGGIERAMEIYNSLVEVIVDKNIVGPSKVCVHARVEWESGKMTPFEM